MIAKEHVQALRKIGLADVCNFNGEYMHSNMKPLTPAEAKKVQEILSSAPVAAKGKAKHTK